MWNKVEIIKDERLNAKITYLIIEKDDKNYKEVIDMNRVIGILVSGILTGIACSIGMKIGQDIIDRVEVTKTKDAKIIKFEA